MNEKQLQLIKFLLKTKEWTTATILASDLNVSIRTVKSYVSDLNRTFPDIIMSSTNGYLVRPATAKTVLHSFLGNGSPVPQTNKERSLFITIRLLRASGPLSLYDLCDDMFISLSTLRIVLKRTKQQLSDYQLELLISGDSIEIIGDEQSRRKLLSSIIFRESKASFFDFDSIQEIFDNLDTDFAINTVNKVLWDFKYYVTDFSLYNIILHIIITIDRNMNSASPSCTDAPKATQVYPLFIPSNIYDMVKTLVTCLKDYYEVEFQTNDMLEFALLFYTHATSLILQEVEDCNLEEYIGKDCTLLLQDMLNLLWDVYGIKLANPESNISFSLHVKNLLIRMQAGNMNHNPLTDSVKTSCPLIYDVAVSLSSVIADKTGIVVSDDEITYIAFHIGNAIEMQRAFESRISVILNCPTYYNMNHDLHERLMERFGNDIIIVDVTISESYLLRYPDIDLVLSTVPLKHNLEIPSIQIQPFLTMVDARIVERSISTIKEDKKHSHFLQETQKILLPEFYEHLCQPMTKWETIHYMCGRLYEAGFSTSNFEAAILEREQLSSTAFTNFSIPHTVNMKELKSCMYILINDQAIPWDESEVHLVIMLCISAADRQIFYTVFEPLSISLLNRAVIQRILLTNSYKEFIQIISEIQ
jgi:lichenan operon transcriptional antiterminator